ncbi:MAG: phosphodiester glycosidase family protein [Leptolyngbyaceae cyanobacterium SM1_3_5]|nr:phosphodiester glycosidase family protein [Leptolyngbyaceae cyanobacterium SM1_3_5]
MLDRLETLAASQDATAAINAGFFDPANGRSTSFISSAGELVADPRQNDRLMQNPDLAPYLGRILDRSEFRQYRCGAEWQAAIAPHSAPIPANCTLHLAIGAGPQLLPRLTAEAEAFIDEAAGRDAIGLRQPNARSAIGLTASGEVVWVMVAQHSEAPQTSGFSLIELAEWLDRAGVVQALNLDGGSSSSFYFQGETFYGKVNGEGQRVERSIKSALLLSAFN